MIMRYFSLIFFMIFVFYSDIFRLSFAFAEDVTGTNQQVVPSENPDDNKQPSITRNPFISAPYGRMGRAPAGTGTNTDTGNVKRDRGDVPLKSLRLRGILTGNDKAAALLSHKIVKTGDMIEDYIVSEISAEGVTLSKGDIVIRFTIE